MVSISSARFDLKARLPMAAGQGAATAYALRRSYGQANKGTIPTIERMNEGLYR